MCILHRHQRENKKPALPLHQTEPIKPNRRDQVLSVVFAEVAGLRVPEWFPALADQATSQ